MPAREGIAVASVTFLNGVKVEGAGAAVSPRDRGLTLADGLFETMRVRRGRVFQLRQHVDRMHRGLLTLRIDAPPELDRCVTDAVVAAGLDEASVRLTVTRGVGGAGLLVAREIPPTVIVTVGAMPVFPVSVYEQGMSAHVPAGRRNARSSTSGVKTLSYTDAVVGLLEAQEHGADEALFLDGDDHCSEASASNLFMVTDATLVTPPISCGALPGITRATVLRLATDLGISAVERVCTLDDLLGSDEAFLTSSLRGIVPLVRVDGREIGAGRPGTLTRRIAAAHEALVDTETAR
jgi:branched-chain amino acid aminotransferase